MTQILTQPRDEADDNQLELDEEEYFQGLASHEFIKLLNTEMYKFMQLNPHSASEDIEADADVFLNEVWEHCHELYIDENNEEYADIDMSLYVKALETLVRQMFYDLHILIRAIAPSNYSGTHKSASGIPYITNTTIVQKVLTNLMVPLAMTGYDYPQGNGNTAAYHSGDIRYRCGTEGEYNNIMNIVNVLPPHWNGLADEFMERNIEFLYGESDVSPAPKALPAGPVH